MNPIPDRRQWRPMNRHRTDGIFRAEKSTIRNTEPNLWLSQARTRTRAGACRLPGADNDGTVVVRRMTVDGEAVSRRQACWWSPVRLRF